MTMGTVARRAHTGVAVLYRRWHNKESLVLAALGHYREQNPVQTPDTGTLRGDLLANLTSLSSARAAVFAVAGAAYLSGLISATPRNPEQVRMAIVGEKIDPRTRPVYLRAALRHDIELDLIPNSVLSMPFDLVSYELAMTFEPVPSSRIVEIVDDLFMPLVERHQSPGRR